MKHYGFIEQDNGEDLFVHASEVKEKGILREGDRVSYEIENSPKGPRAVKVVKL